MTDPSAASSAPFDARVLTAPIDRAAFAEFRRTQKALDAQKEVPLGRVFAWVVAVIAIGFVVAVGSTVLTLVLGGSRGGSWLVPVFVVVAAVAIIGFLATRRARWVRRYRLHAFALANGMTYEALVTDPPLPGMIFSLGHSRRAEDLVRGDRPRFVEFGNYTYTTGSGKNAQTHHWGYIAIKLDVPLPNIVLDASSNDGLFGSNLPARFTKDQRLSLEGDFDRHFSLFCPAGYERDALYLFTPDVMVRFLDHAAHFDVEIVDDWMFLYTQRPVATLEEPVWQAAFSAVAAVLTKLDQWARWRDDRLRTTATPASPDPSAPADAPADAPASTAAVPGPVAPLSVPFAPPPGVAPAGRRLRRSGSWIGIVVFVVVGAVWLWLRVTGS
ncbi:hypothetical protein PFZ55_50660 [Streptomyces sp. MS2A]|nr:hypothetical protein [Streptomyces sp. MS2A]